MLNYIAVFLTLRCNLNCSYCINRQSDFVVPEEMSGKDWIKGLSKIQTRNDLPISLQGGEPTLHRAFFNIANELHNQGKQLDLLTNGMFDEKEFMKRISPDVFKRDAPYASIRFSYHEKTLAWELCRMVNELKINNYSVGIWGIDSFDNRGVEKLCKGYGIDFRLKEFLDTNHGTYKYPEGINGKKKRVLCKTTELLIGPSGHIFKCHADLYSNRYSIGHILDESLPSFDYRVCDNFGACNSCDLKLKTNRLQEGGHCSVNIKEEA
jgi:sulfatase maturation enzyme AslB (radical SAM superfamily)